MKEKPNNAIRTGKLTKTISLILGIAFVAFGVVHFVQNDGIGFGEDALVGVAIVLAGFLAGDVLIERGEKEIEAEEKAHEDEGL